MRPVWLYRISNPSTLSVWLSRQVSAAPCVRPSLLLSARTRVSSSVKRRRLAPPPLLFHNIRYKVTVCCGPRTLITRQENNVVGKAVQHHRRSVSPRGLSRPFKWLLLAEPWKLNKYMCKSFTSYLLLYLFIQYIIVTTFPVQGEFSIFFFFLQKKKSISFFIMRSRSKAEDKMKSNDELLNNLKDPEDSVLHSCVLID